MQHEGRLQAWQAAAKERSAKGLVVACRLAGLRRWDGDVWQATLHGLKDGAYRVPIFRRVAPLMVAAPDTFFRDRGEFHDVGRAIASWMYATTRGLPTRQEETFWRPWSRAATIAFVDAAMPTGLPNGKPDRDLAYISDHDPFAAAENHPAGILTRCLLLRLDVRKISLGGGLPPPLRERLTEITEESGQGYRHARVILARSLPYFYAVDPDWTSGHLLRWFDWSNNKREASAVWYSYLTGGAFGSPDLFFALKDRLIDCNDHEEELGKAFEQFWYLVMLAAFEIPNAFSRGQVKRLLSRSESGRKRAAFAIWRYMPEDKPGEPARGADYWRSRVRPFIATEWPQDRNMRSSETSEHLALAALRSADAFPEAVDTIAPFLIPVTNHPYLQHWVASYAYPEEHPESCLLLLEKLIDTSVRGFLVGDLRSVLERIPKARISSQAAEAWERLHEFVIASGAGA